jgi:hypothetical protein
MRKQVGEQIKQLEEMDVILKRSKNPVNLSLNELMILSVFTSKVFNIPICNNPKSVAVLWPLMVFQCQR